MDYEPIADVIVRHLRKFAKDEAINQTELQEFWIQFLPEGDQEKARENVIKLLAILDGDEWLIEREDTP